VSKNLVPNLRAAALWSARAMESVGFAATFAAALACALAAMNLAGRAETYFEAAGGLTFLTYLRGVTTPEAAKLVLPNLHVRAMWYALSWACAVFACGFGCLAVAGARSLYWRGVAVLRALQA